MAPLQFFKGYWVHHIRLDIIGIVAILGEASVELNKQPSFLSPFGFLPRLLPAPQALIPPRRPTRLEPEDAVVVGSKSGNYRPHLNPVAHILHDGESLEVCEVRCVELISKPIPPETALESFFKGAAKRLLPKNVAAKLDPPTIEADGEPPVRIEINRWSPLTGLAIFGCALFLSLLTLSVHFGDGWSFVATMLLGWLSTLIQYGCWHTVQLPSFNLKRPLPPADVVIWYPSGSFIIVECKEKLARKLYLGIEQCKYAVNDSLYRLVALFGTFTLIAAILALGNAGTWMQFYFAISYIVLNICYWLVAAVPEKYHWKTSGYELKVHAREQCDNYTEALWTAMAATGTTEWVGIAPNLAPQSSPWKKWFSEAQQQLDNFTPGKTKDKKIKKPPWKEQNALTRLLREATVADVPAAGSQVEPTVQPSASDAAAIPSEEEQKLEQTAESEALKTVTQASPQFAFARSRA